MGMVYDLWFHPASYHEARSLRIRYRKSKWLRFLVDSFGLMEDRGYRRISVPIFYANILIY